MTMPGFGLCGWNVGSCSKNFECERLAGLELFALSM